MKTISNKNAGISILGVLILTVIAIVVLSYFGISLKSVVESPTAQGNFSYVGTSSRNLWTDYLAKPVADVLNSTIIKTLWSSFLSNMQRIHDGQPTDIQLLAPSVPLPSNQ